RLVAPLLTRLARWATTSTVSRSVAVSAPASASCGADSAAPGSQAMARTSAVARRAGTSRESRAAAGRARKEDGEEMGMGKTAMGRRPASWTGAPGLPLQGNWAARPFPGGRTGTCAGLHIEYE